MKTAIIILGPPGAGKGTQARLLSETLNFAHVSTGDILRTAIKNGTELGWRAKTFLEAGLLVPDELVDAIVCERLRQKDCGKGFILDGYPRTFAQADTLHEVLDQDDILTLVIGIRIPDEVLIARLGSRWICPNCNRTFSKLLSSGKLKGLCDKCSVELIHRADDAVEVITERLKIYHEQTESLVRYYQERGIYVPINGDQLPAKIFYAIRGVLEERKERMASALAEKAK
ncbi:MAG: adenylate kinase [Acidobacteria bacterium]|nr:adenylate kinase [Acidobacteriota bacterium]